MVIRRNRLIPSPDASGRVRERGNERKVLPPLNPLYA
jgi:hypothetical protein